jgi:arylsulfatase
MATCCEVAGVDYPKRYQGKTIKPLVGKSLLPVLRGETRTEHETLYWEHIGNKAVRQGKWKLVAANRGNWELYDIEADRTELHDLSTSNPEKLRELIARYDTWASQNGVKPVR